MICGMSNKTYSEKLKDPRWQKKRLEILQRDNWTCISCGGAKNTLHVHHKYYTYGNEPWEYSNDVLVTLCEHCHVAEESFKEVLYDMPRDLLRAGFDNAQLFQLTAFLQQLRHKIASVEIVDIVARLCISEEFYNDVMQAHERENERIKRIEYSKEDKPF
jgi:hypothetical protein